MLLRSRIVLAVTAPPLEDGAVLISGNRITAVGRWMDLQSCAEGPVLDLGEVVLLPGLVNAHCHLDYTRFAGHLAPPRRFTDWLQGVLGLKAEWSFSEFAASWLTGAGQLLHTGCTSVMDFEAVPELLPDVWQGTPLRVISAMELTGVRAGRRPEDILAEALARVDRLEPPEGKSIALAPHAPYSTRPELLRLAAEAARTRGMRLACHVAESADEFEMFMEASGPMYQWLKSQRDMIDCGKGSPVRHVAAQGLLGTNTLLVHVNHLAEGDAELIAKSGASVVHCPRSHEYFDHALFPYRRLRDAGVPVGLGTDSLLSVRKTSQEAPRLSVFAEMQAFLRAHPEVPPEEVLSMATVESSRVMGRGGELGELREGALADLAVVPFGGRCQEAAAAVVHHGSEVPRVMIGGRWVVGPPGE